MAQVTIAQLPPAGTANADDLVAIWQGTTTRSVTLQNLLAKQPGYATGNWTPQLQFGGANVAMTVSSQAGRYVRIGPFVWCEGRIVLSNKGTSTGNATIAGLPFTPSVAYCDPANVFWLSLAQSMTQVTGIVSGSSLALYSIAAAAISLTAMTDAHFGNGSQLRFGVRFFTPDAMPAFVAAAPPPDAILAAPPPDQIFAEELPPDA